ncbi:MAG: hypothetical protein WBQ76_15140 [Candidatus Korobacteraceae bacterium]
MAMAILLLSAVAFAADTFHVTAIHRATETEKTYRTAFSQNLITGTVGNRRYTLEQLTSWGFYRFQVGADYEVVKGNDKTLKLRVTDKKGRESTESLNVVTVEEVK